MHERQTSRKGAPAREKADDAILSHKSRSRRAYVRWRQVRRLLNNAWAFLSGFLKALFDARLEHYAASLSWSTLFALIPLIVVMTAVLSSLPLFEDLKADLERQAYAFLLPEKAAAVRTWLDRFTANASALGWLGVAYVTLTVVLFVRTFDFIVNDICEAPIRNPWQIVRDYGLLILAIPLLAGSAYAVSVQLDAWLGGHTLTRWIHPLSILPWLLVWGAFFLLYARAPNRRMDMRAVAISSFLAALVWSATRWLFVLYVSRSQTYESIYGSVASALFFLLWIHLSWATFLYGLKFCRLLERQLQGDDAH